jgi:transposase-like protein
LKDAHQLSIAQAAVHDAQRVLPDSTACPRCHKASLVRFENVIRAGRSARHFYCGGCHYSWAVATDDETGRTTAHWNDRAATGIRT